mmetsp:Transcript_13825/g.37368  ORF Transcript_13825/g.37368 Transcript_13825/m.37368 type:complete len:858 (-) Transcript_13825:79-2652(-)
MSLTYRRNQLVHGMKQEEGIEDAQSLLFHEEASRGDHAPAGEGYLAKEKEKLLYESLNYEDLHNTVHRAERASSTSMDGIAYLTSRWGICLLIGVITGIAAFAVNVSVENISGFKFWATLSLMNKGHIALSFLVYFSISTVLVFCAVALTAYVGPAAAGSGIAEVKAYLNGIDMPGIFFFSTLFAKLAGSVGAVAGGLAIGKEGPFVHAGACIAALLSQGGPSGSGQAPRWASKLWTDHDRSDMVAVGAAAGVAAAFRSPVGGVLFALEEMTSWWRKSLMWRCFFTTAVVSVTVRALMKTCSANGCGVFGSGGLIIYEISEGQDNYEIYELIPVLLLGVIGGLLGSSFIAINAKLTVWRKENVSKLGARAKIAEALLVSILTSAVSFLLPLIFSCQQCPTPDGIDCPRQQHLHSGNFVAFNCEDSNEYSDLATLFFNTQDDAIRNLFSSKTKREYTVSSLVVFVSAFYFLAIITYGISCPTGLFVPSILCGAAYGRLVGIFVADLQSFHNIDEGTYALLGAASFLGGSMRMTVSSCVMLLELTNNLALLPLVMLVLLVAKTVGDGTGVKPIYEVQMQNKGLPFLAPSGDILLQHITAKECCGRPPVTFQRVEKVQRVLEVLNSCSHNGFPVINQTGEGRSGRSIMGMILRQHLLKLLFTKRCFQASPFVTEVSSKIAASYTTADFCKPISASGLSPADIQLDEEQLGMYMDLGPYANPSYYVVQEDMSLSKVYTLFRTLALRHVCVIPRAHDVVGIISRKDLLPETIDAQFSQNRGQYTPDGSTLSTLEDTLPIHSHTTSRSAGASPAPVLRTSGLGSSSIGAAMSGGAEVVQAGTGDREVALTVEGVIGRRTHRQP